MLPQMKQKQTTTSKIVDLIVYLLFVALATAVWFGHALGSVRNASIQVPISYVGVPENVGLADTLAQSITVTIRDNGRRLRLYRSSMPQLEFDLSSMVTHQHGTIHIGQDAIRQSLTAQLRGTSNIQDFSPKEINGTYYRQQEKVVPIVAEYLITPAPQFLLLDEPQLNATEVKIFGQKKILDDVKAIHTRRYEQLLVREDICEKLGLVAPEGVRLGLDSVELSVAVEQFTEKTFTLPIKALHTPHGKFLRLFPSSVSVTVRVPMSHYADVNEEDIIVNCNFPHEESPAIPVVVHATNPFVTSARAFPSEVEYIIENHVSAEQ